jgi:adenine-specific DNA methylase
MADFSRLIEHAFPLQQTSLDSVHEKSVRHGHISTLHIWPARRPLAACRAALIATLLPDPGTAEGRKELCERIGGILQSRLERKKMPSGEIVERERMETVGGILHWGRETENADELEKFRAEIRKAYGGRAPKVLDPFAGGGAIPLEAMRLGCEATAIDINPVAWFILKCTLEYPRLLAGKKLPLPPFILEDETFMAAFHKAFPSTASGERKRAKEKCKGNVEFPELEESVKNHSIPDADLGWQLRAWGTWVLNHARKELADCYPTYASFEPLPLTPKEQREGLALHAYERKEMRLIAVDDSGQPEIVAANADYGTAYLRDKRNPRWVAKTTVAYLWARTVICKNCRAEVPLLKTRWLCKKDRKRVLLTMEAKADKMGVVFGIRNEVPVEGRNAAQRREADRRLAAGTMSRTGVTCPCCKAIMTMEDIRLEGRAGRLGAVNTAVVVDGAKDKEYRLPTAHELDCARRAEESIDTVFDGLPFRLPIEPTPKGGSGASRAFSVDGYGLNTWSSLFTNRQLFALGTFVKWTREARATMRKLGYSAVWIEAIGAYLASMADRLANQNSTGTMWNNIGEKVEQTFARFALPIHWDYPETNMLSDLTGGYTSALQWVSLVSEHLSLAETNSPASTVIAHSATSVDLPKHDLIITDPPYYDAIPYSDLMDFFYVWLRRSIFDLSPAHAALFSTELGPKWDAEANDGELIDDSSRHGGTAQKSKYAYEDGMSRAFTACHRNLEENGRMVIVFANKKPEAWETLVSAMIRAGFVVDGSWPITTEMSGGVRNFGRASLASSVWLVCRKRPAGTKPGWDSQVLAEMKTNIKTQLREFWDAGIRGPDFVWAATGPALEAYSKFPAVRKADVPDAILGVGEFLSEVRRIVVDFVVGRVLDVEGSDTGAEADHLDQPTAYYLLHRHDFGMGDAPAGACILYALSCGLSDKALADTWDLVAFTAGGSGDEDVEEDAGEDDDGAEGSGMVRLKAWDKRRKAALGLENDSGRSVPHIDRVHRLMRLWKAGDLSEVDDYIDSNGLRKQELFRRLVQALIELAPHASEERSILESISNHLGARGAIAGREIELDLGNGETS